MHRRFLQLLAPAAFLSNCWTSASIPRNYAIVEIPAQVSALLAAPAGARTARLKHHKFGVVAPTQPFKMPPSITGQTHLRYAWSEASTAFQGLYQCLEAFWVNKPINDAAASHKPWQLMVAQQCGLEIPDTLMTTDPVDARCFWNEHPDEIIYKQFIALPEAWRETRRLNNEDRDKAEAIRLAPVIFQHYVSAVSDLRVIEIGDELFAASTDVEQQSYPEDVRFNSGVRYVPHALPQSIADQLHALMTTMGLTYGAIDLSLTSDARYVFLEINPAGQFLYIEKATGQPISAALASILAKGG